MVGRPNYVREVTVGWRASSLPLEKWVQAQHSADRIDPYGSRGVVGRLTLPPMFFVASHR